MSQTEIYTTKRGVIRRLLQSDTQYLIVLASLLIALLHMGATAILLPAIEIVLLMDTLLLIALGVILVLYHQRRVRVSGILLIIVLWLYMTLGSLFLGGVQNPLFESYVVLIIIAGLLYREAGVLFAVSLSVLSGLGLFILDLTGQLPAALIPITSMYIWVAVMANMGMITLLSIVVLRDFRRSANQRQKTTQALVQERHTLRTLIDTLPDPIYIKDTDSRFVMANHRQAQLAGVESYHELIGKTELDIFPQSGQNYYDDDRQLFASGEPIINKQDVIREHVDEPIWVLMSKVPLRDKDGRITGMVGIGRDITAMRHTQDALRQREMQAQALQDKLRTLHTATLELAQIAASDALYRRAIEIGREELGFDRLALFLIDRDTDTIIGTYGTDTAGNIRAEHDIVRPLDNDDRAIEVIKSRRRSCYWLDVELWDKWQVVGTGWCAMAMLWDGDTSIGWLVTDNLINRESFSENMVELLSLYGATLGYLITRRQAETNLQHSQQQLQSRTEALRALYKITEVVHQSLDTQSVAQEALRAFQSYLNMVVGSVYLYDPESDHMAMIAQLNIPDEYRERWRVLPVSDSLTGRTLQNNVVTIYHRHQIDEDSSVERVPFEVLDIDSIVSIPIYSGDHILGTINLAFAGSSIATDIEGQGIFASIGNTLGLAITNSRSLDEISHARDLSDSIIESMPDIFFMFTEDGRLLRWNENLELVTGYSAAELAEMTPHMLFTTSPPETLQRVFSFTLSDGGSGVNVNLMSRHADHLPYILTTQRYRMGDQRAIIATGINISERNELMNRLEYRATQLQVAGQISKSIVTVLSPAELLDYTVNLVCDEFDYYYVGLFLNDHNEEYAVLRAGSGDTGQEMIKGGHRLMIGGKSMIGRAVAAAKPYIADDVAQIPEHYANPYLPATRSEMALPLINRGVCLGAMTVQSTQVSAFSQEDIHIIQFIVDHLASALANAELYDIIIRRQRYLGTLRHVSQQASPELDIDDFLYSVATALKQEFNYVTVVILLLNADQTALHMRAAIIDNAYIPNIDLQTYTQAISEGIFGWVVRHRSPYLAHDMRTDPLHEPIEGMNNEGSAIAVPITRFNDCIGVLSVSTADPNQLDDLDVEMLDEFSSELGIHIENLRLYAKTRRNADELEKRVAERTSQLKAVNKELEAFAYSVSHDLRAPLRSIDGFSQALLEDYEDEIDEFGQDFLHRIRAASQRMGQLIDDMLTLSRVTRREFVRQEVDLTDLAHIVAGIIRQTYPRDNVEIVIEDGVTAYADRNMIQIVLENLLGNAWKFTSKEETGRIEFGTERDDTGETVYYVRDNGVGFDMAYADKLFGAFQRLHAMSDFEGTGVGLATVQRVIMRHQGQVWATATEGEGATFYFKLGGDTS